MPYLDDEDEDYGGSDHLINGDESDIDSTTKVLPGGDDMITVDYIMTTRSSVTGNIPIRNGPSSSYQTSGWLTKNKQYTATAKKSNGANIFHLSKA